MTGYSGLYDRMTPEQIGFAEADFIEKYHVGSAPLLVFIV